MEIEIKNYTSPDILDFKHFVPTDEKLFSFLLELEIGIKGKQGADLFEIQVCTPQWLLDNYKISDVVFCRNRLIVFEYDFENIITKIKQFISTVSGNSWEEIAIKLARIGRWEFEDYKK